MTVMSQNAPAWVHAVLPSEIVRQRQLGWPDFHPEDFCHICGRRNPVWSAPAADWNALGGSHAGVYCPSCFAEMHASTTDPDTLYGFGVLTAHPANDAWTIGSSDD